MIYVVDSADRDRMGISKSELYAMLEVCGGVWGWGWVWVWVGGGWVGVLLNGLT